MKFVYLGYDFMLDTAFRLIDDGHELCAIFTFPCDNKTAYNLRCYELAKKLSIPVVEKQITDTDCNTLIGQGASCFVAAGYPYKVPDIDDKKAYALNIHPALLPKGRGLMPVPTIIMSAPYAAGLTIHKMSSVYDGGDILAQVPFELAVNETVEMYGTRTVLAAPDLLSSVCRDIKDHWKNAVLQNADEAETFPVPDQDMQLIDWTKPIDDIDKKLRAFGCYGGLMVIDQSLYSVRNHDVIVTSHDFAAGSCLVDQNDLKVVAVSGGYMVLKDFEFIEAISL